MMARYRDNEYYKGDGSPGSQTRGVEGIEAKQKWKKD